MPQLDAAALTQLVRGEGTAVEGEAIVQRLSMLGGVAVVLLANLMDKIDGVIDADVRLGSRSRGRRRVRGRSPLAR